jgi:hypothetical protein
MAATRLLLINRSANGARWDCTCLGDPRPPPYLASGSAWRVVQLFPLQGFSLAANRSSLEYRGTRATFVAYRGNGEREKVGICRSFSEPSDGLEPSTPSLPDLQIRMPLCVADVRV